MHTKSDRANEVEFLTTRASRAFATVLLAHGSNSPMDNPFLDRITELLTVRGLDIVRFEFAYMAGRRHGGKRRPPPSAEKLRDEYAAAIIQLSATDKLAKPFLIGGKSLGGRVASMIAADLYTAKAIDGFICLGYPFHPQNKPDKLRIAHLQAMVCPALIVQGERDPLGALAEVETYSLDPKIQFQWLCDGNHDFSPRLSSGYTNEDNMIDAANAVTTFAKSLVRTH